MTDWRAHISDDFRALATDSRRVVIWRRVGNDTETISGFDDTGVAVVQHHPEHAAANPTGFLIPAEALEALGKVLNPGPSRGEMSRLEDALTVERRRVDDMLAKLRDTDKERT